MAAIEPRTVLHVMPHPGGGGETYVDLLERMEGYRFERIFLSPTPQPLDALRALPRSAVELVRSADLVHVHGEVAAAICLPVIAARPSVLTLHGLHLLRRSTGAKRTAAEWNLRALVRAASKTICVSEAERVEVLEVVGAKFADRAVTIHNGVDPHDLPSSEERAATRSELGLEPEEVVGVFVGSLVDHKDPLAAARAALDVAAEGEPLVLVVAGDGPLRPDLDRIAALSAAVRVIGHRSDVIRVLSAADFFVLLSLREGLSFSLLEAMSLGLPSVVSDAPGNPEAVGAAGIVVPRGDQSAVAAAFRECLDRPNRSSLGELARARVADHFRADAMVADTQRVYDDALA
jgi:glycosyltransferase involved in cell wall biosynthesis